MIEKQPMSPEPIWDFSLYRVSAGQPASCFEIVCTKFLLILQLLAVRSQWEKNAHLQQKPPPYMWVSHQFWSSIEEQGKVFRFSSVSLWAAGSMTTSSFKPIHMPRRKGQRWGFYRLPELNGHICLKQMTECFSVPQNNYCMTFLSHAENITFDLYTHPYMCVFSAYFHK